MKISRALIILTAIAVVAISLYSMSGGQSHEEYIAAVLKEREEKNDFMKNSEESPFAKERESFSSLKYFDPDPAYRVTAKLELIKNKKVVALPTSLNEQNSYLEYAWADFEINGTKNRLLLLEVMASGPTRGTLFLAFADGTSAKETYGAGRYLEVKKVPGAGTMVLDFNNAYNPYCAYVDNYSCPFPPRENVLAVEIRAGEKTYH